MKDYGPPAIDMKNVVYWAEQLADAMMPVVKRMAEAAKVEPESVRTQRVYEHAMAVSAVCEMLNEKAGPLANAAIYQDVLNKAGFGDIVQIVPGLAR